MQKRILIGSPIHQKPSILKYFLESLTRLNTDGIDIHYLFIDDNNNIESKNLLNDFSQIERNVNIVESGSEDEYMRNDQTHFWNDRLIWKVAGYKDSIIQVAEENDCDYLFLVDSDLVLHPNTLQQLITSNKDIISNIFWTKWQPNYPELPQVWIFDSYEQYYKRRVESLTEDEKKHRHYDFLNKLRKPGVYEVGGLGACTLISKQAIKKGVNFGEIKNLSFWGEDRHFCVRAHALGIDLYVDTHYPAFHIYRESDLGQIENYIRKTNTTISKTEFYNIIKAVISGIEGLGTTPDRNQVEWEQYFTEECLNNISGQEDSENSNSRIDATVCDVFLKKLENHQKVAVVEFLLNNRGIYENNRINDKYNCEVFLIKRNDKWLINELLIIDKLNE